MSDRDAQTRDTQPSSGHGESDSAPPGVDELFGEPEGPSRLERMQQRELCLRIGLPAPPPEYVGGRYRLDELLGRGGMGEVYRALDKEADREVALKLINTSKGYPAELTARLVREARTLAKLDHPNVVTLYSIETHGDETCVIMAYVRGSTLGEWQAGRTKNEILAKYVQAAEGLAAAHAAGIVHRDFKPDNAIVGNDRKLRVLDFGIAAAIRDQEPPPPTEGHERGDDHQTQDSEDPQPVLVESTILTRAGAQLGTVMYMSPEQLAGRRVDARSDQFNFCVALWQALCHEHPFPVETGKTRAQSMAEPPRGKAKLDRWLQPILSRGLDPDPAKRYPDMRALINALGSRERRLRRWGYGLFGTTSFALAVAFGGWIIPGKDVPLETCEAFTERVDDYWGTDRALDLTRKLSEVDPLGHSYVVGELSSLAEDWERHAGEACKGDFAPAEDSDRHRCMTQWLVDFDRVVERLGEANAEELQQAPQLLVRLAPIAGDYCAIQPSHEVAPEVLEPSKVARESASLGDFETAQRKAEDALALARSLPGAARYDLERAEAYAAFGEVLAFASDDSGALDKLEQASAHARATAYHPLELQILTQRIKQAAIGSKLELAAALIEQLEPLAELLMLGPDDPRRGEIHEALGYYEAKRGDYDASIEHHREAERIFTAAGRPLDAAKSVFNRGERQRARGDAQVDSKQDEAAKASFAQAKASFEAARAMFRAEGVGPRFRNLLTLELSFGYLALNMGQADEALAHLDYVVEHGPPTMQIDALVFGLITLTGYGEIPADKLEAIRARAKRLEQTLANNPETSAPTRHNAYLILAYVATETGTSATVEAHMRASLAVAAKLGPVEKHGSMRTLATWLHDQGRCDEAEAMRQRLIPVVEAGGADIEEFSAWHEAERVRPCPSPPRP